MAAVAVRASGGIRWGKRSEHCQRGDPGPGGRLSESDKGPACGSSAGSAHLCPVRFPRGVREEEKRSDTQVSMELGTRSKLGLSPRGLFHCRKQQEEHIQLPDKEHKVPKGTFAGPLYPQTTGPYPGHGQDHIHIDIWSHTSTQRVAAHNSDLGWRQEAEGALHSVGYLVEGHSDPSWEP